MQLTTWVYDGGANVHAAFALSGEMVAEQVANAYGYKPTDEMTASKIAETNVAKRQYQKEYMEYWNSTEKHTGTGRPVDAFIAPLAPFPAARPTKYSYYGYSTFVNLLDYTSCVIPVTTVDEKVDVIDKNFKPVSEQDQKVWNDCKHCSPNLLLLTTSNTVHR